MPQLRKNINCGTFDFNDFNKNLIIILWEMQATVIE